MNYRLKQHYGSMKMYKADIKEGNWIDDTIRDVNNHEVTYHCTNSSPHTHFWPFTPPTLLQDECPLPISEPHTDKHKENVKGTQLT